MRLIDEPARRHADGAAMELAECLRSVLGDGLVTDPAARRAHSADLLGHGTTATLLVRPASVEELTKAVALVAGFGFAMVPRGGGLTYVSGYTSTKASFVAIDLRRMDRIVEINEQDM